MTSRRILTAALPLALVVVVLGAFTRLSDAGLGCPDWPACYGQIVGVPDAQTARSRHPDAPLDPRKAWIEVIHRYAAALLGLVALAALAAAFRNRETGRKIVLALMILILAQAILGALTVTRKLQPIIVTAHLLGGMSILFLLALAVARPPPPAPSPNPLAPSPNPPAPSPNPLVPSLQRRHAEPGRYSVRVIPPADGRWSVRIMRAAAIATARVVARVVMGFVSGPGVFHIRQASGLSGLKKAGIIAVLALAVQIALGGWVSANYAGIACGPQFPKCQNQFVPPDFTLSGFAPARQLGLDSDGRPVGQNQLAAIHFVHRTFAWAAALALFVFAWKIGRAGGLRAAGILLGLLALQFFLGIFIAVFNLPFWAALGHNAVAALLATQLAFALRPCFFESSASS